jgi:acetyl-CoA acetyltransferase
MESGRITHINHKPLKKKGKTMTTENSDIFKAQDPQTWRRDKPGLGVWEHRGKVAVVGLGHSVVDRRWDEVNLDTSLGAYSILACQKAMDDAGVTKEQVDGILICQETVAGAVGGVASNWAPRPYFDAPYDSEWGITRVKASWLIQTMGFPNIKYAPDCNLMPGEMMGQAVQAVGDGLCTTCLVIYPSGNLSGRYRRGGDNAKDTAEGGRQWTVPWGNHGGNDFVNVFPLQQYCYKYNSDPDKIAPFVVNQHKNGRMTSWGFYSNNEQYIINSEDYLASRYILRPLRLWDCDRPVNASAAWLVTTAERAQDMKQNPVYVLNHAEPVYPPRSTQPVLDDLEAATEIAAEIVLEGSGLGRDEVDIFNPYDGYSYMTQFWLEAFRWHGVKRGEAHDFYQGDISVHGPHPFNSSGGNLGCGRTRTAHCTDSIEQLRGTAGERQVKVRADTAIWGIAPPLGGGWLTFSKTPN